MKFNKEEILKTAIESVQKYKLIFQEEVISYLPCCSSTFYSYFPDGSDGLEKIKRAMIDNRVQIKTGLRKKWYDSNAPAVQIALYKLIASETERRILNGQETDEQIKGEDIEDLTKRLIGGLIEKVQQSK